MEIVRRLDWPVGWKRAPKRREARFDMSYDRSVASLREEIRMLGGRDARLTHNPYARGADPGDTGVAVYFVLDGVPKNIACDEWLAVRDNVRAIALSIGAIRGLARWGASGMIDRAFAGFDALPAPRSCWDVLGVRPGASAADIETAYRRAAKLAHPDTGGSDSAMSELNAARDEAMRKVAA
jgi:hypothetical protein